MAKTIASLSVSINASTKGLRKGLKNANKIIGNFAASATRAIADVAKIGAGLASLGAGIAAAGTLKAMSSLNNLAKTARKLDIEPTMLVALRDAAKESGVEIKTFDMGLQRMLRRIQEASKGKGEALGALADLGLDPKQLARMAPEKQFEAVAKAMEATKDEGLRLARAMKLFDSEGVALINTLQLVNEKGLKPFIDEAIRSGRGGEGFERRLSNIEQLLDSVGRIANYLKGAFGQLALMIAGPLEAAFKRFEIFILKNSGAIQQVFARMERAGYAATRAILQYFTTGTGPIAEMQQKLEGWAESAKQKFSDVSTAIHNMIARVREAIDLYEKFWKISGNFRRGALELGGAAFDTARGLDKGAQQILGANNMSELQRGGRTMSQAMEPISQFLREKIDMDSRTLDKISSALTTARGLWARTGFTEQAMFNYIKGNAARDPGTPELLKALSANTQAVKESTMRGGMQRTPQGQYVLISP